MKNIFCIIISIAFVLSVKAQSGTVLSTTVFDDDVLIRDPLAITMKSGFSVGGGRYLRAYIGDGSFSNTIPSSITSPTNNVVSLSTSTSQNYIRSTMFRSPFTAVPTSFNRTDAAVDVQYFDGLGRLIQSVAAFASPNGIDVINETEYDDFGRASRQHLPFESNMNQGSYDASWEYHKNYFYGTNLFDHWPTGDKNTTVAETKFENSPLNRVLQQGAPGADWQPDTHPVEFKYLTNTGNMTSFKFNGNNFSGINYSPGTLFVTKIIDEDDHETMEYKDFEGKVICKTVTTISGTDRTLYCYDDFGLLRCVVPPKATIPANSPALHDLCFYYRYDARKRLIEKKIPDADWVFLIYDARDRLVLSQDGNQRLNHYWSYLLYDHLNRETESGEIYLQDLVGELRLRVNGTLNLIDSYSQRIGQIYTYYDEQSNVTDYPGYNYLQLAGFTSPLDLAQSNRGRVVGKKVRIDETAGENIGPIFLMTVYHYDNLGRMVQEVSNNQFGYVNRFSTRYNFANEVVQTHWSSSLPGGTVTNVDEYFSYDHRGRLLKTSMKINDGTEVVISQNQYNALGQLTTKYLHSINNSPFLQKLDYKYNVRGWLSQINSPDLSDNDGDKFGMFLAYNIPLRGVPCYNGNISGMEWGANANIKYQYNFEYDAKNQLESADFYKYGLTGLEYDTEYSYDKNGNIRTLKRYDKKGTLIDDIQNFYMNGWNIIEYNVDHAGDAEYLPDFPGTVSANQFIYDKNGNMTQEQALLYSINYNKMNLPAMVTQGDNITGFKMFNYFSYEGQKLRKVVNTGSNPVTTDYMGPLVFTTENSTMKLDYIITPEGRAVNTGTTANPVWEWEYNLTDHLGNVRVVLKGDNPNTAMVVQENHYYPFGMLMADIGAIGDNPYLYNGKEYHPELDLNWYDYGARFYDPALGRWTTPDPLAEKYGFQSSFVYAANNPCRFIDFMGMNAKDKVDKDKTLVIDAGHGGKASGSAARSGKKNEREINLIVAKGIEKNIGKSNLQISQTRKTNNENPSFKDRQNAGKGKDAFVSVHANAAGKEVAGKEVDDPKPDYIAVFIREDASVDSKELATSIINSMNNSGLESQDGFMVKVTNTRTGVLSKNANASVLVEMGFMTNPKQEELMQTDSYLNTISASIANGIADYFGYTNMLPETTVIGSAK
ncbi:MAG: N-acetylmuramoyl-L-alanine amidase [Prolixibacteraceae bacterium]